MVSIRFKTHKINKNKAKKEINERKREILEDKNSSIDFYKTMKEIKELETHCEDLYKKKLIRGFCHLCFGQEHIYAALKHVINDDYVMTSYRCHGLANICGISSESILAELLGKQNGCSKGKGGSMHLYNDKFLGGHGIVGSQVPLATGLAFNISYRNKVLKEKNEKIVYCFFGDGASNQGQVSESFKLAKLYNLKIVYVCENNSMGMWTHESYLNKGDPIYKRPPFPAIRTSVTNPIKLASILKYAKKICTLKGPILIEIKTKRECKHSERDEINDLISNKKTVFEKFRNFLLSQKTCNIDEIDSEIEIKMAETVENVKKSKPSEIEGLFKDIYL